MSKKYKGIKHSKRWFMCLGWRMDIKYGVIFFMPNYKEYRCALPMCKNRHKGLKHRR
ncbi:MAG: hypothetical protein LBE34_12725 [Flavobacteriaceae bacterium]|jgi:hypothetical protein|nr:hypothetical protein [Flavobacteriaceae bacterium]